MSQLEVRKQTTSRMNVFCPLRHPKGILARLHRVESHYEAMEGWSKLTYDYVNVSRRSIRPLMGVEMSYVDGSNPLSSVKSPAVSMLGSGLMPAARSVFR